MIRIEGPNSHHILTLRSSGEITAADIDTLTPILEQAQLRNEELRVLEHIEGDVSVSPQAVVQEIRLARRFLKLINRSAVVCDSGLVRGMGRVLGLLAPFATQTFEDEELAVDWLTSPHNAASVDIQYKYDNRFGFLAVTISDPLSGADIACLEDILSNAAHLGTELHVLLCPRQDSVRTAPLGALSHMRFLRQHSLRVRRVALVADSRWQQTLHRTAARFINADLKIFSPCQRSGAQAWVFDGPALTAGTEEPAGEPQA